ncbi:transcription factor CP2-like isoform X3 [Dreissena polymorpha]|uniref:transcription factor CP2-like isoform X3 n=1 Tax=Dreissena polymorpha TaxID=45954 RepID=UPI002264505E|nr:transcription factor CP2-like isoform X3 [Dreissena polymorpha]
MSINRSAGANHGESQSPCLTATLDSLRPIIGAMIHGSGKRTKTSHYSEVKSPSTPRTYTEVKTLTYHDMSHTFSTNTTSGSNWDIDGGLAADFDGSLSGLGTELGAATYNMRFQYILGAATSPAVKVNEETLTYLNQGQSYEVKLKKLGDLTEYDGYLRSTIRVCFHERRLQFMEKELLDFWIQARPGERFLDVDIPLSYGLINVSVEPGNLNSIDFIWDPSKETGIYVKVNCISTEFTAKKHGGEKGVPFRLQVETMESDHDDAKLIHCASSQIKVFKPKGADRKHKTDREKMEKRTGSEKEKYQPSYECTVLTEVPIEQVIQASSTRNGLTPTGSFGSLAQAFKEQGVGSTPKSAPKIPAGMDQWRWPNQQSCSPTNGTDVQTNSHDKGRRPTTPLEKKCEPTSPFATDSLANELYTNWSPQQMSVNATAKEVQAWLNHNRFTNYTSIFQNFAGADILRLTRDDLIQICGLADGIRLNNALQSRTVRPRLTLFMCKDSDTVYHAVYLEQLSCQELIQKIADLINVNRYSVSDVFMQGPSLIRINLTDEVVRNLQDQSRFWVEISSDTENQDYVRVLLKGIE